MRTPNHSEMPVFALALALGTDVFPRLYSPHSPPLFFALPLAFFSAFFIASACRLASFFLRFSRASASGRVSAGRSAGKRMPNQRPRPDSPDDDETIVPEGSVDMAASCTDGRAGSVVASRVVLAWLGRQGH